MFPVVAPRGRRAQRGAAVAALVVGTLCAGSPTATAAAKKKGKKPGAAAITIDLSELALEGDPALTLTLPEDLWRAHLVGMLEYPKKNQLTEAEGPRVAERWLQSEVADGRGFNAEIFIVVEPRSGDSLREWARYIADESDSIFPFEDAAFDGPWIINQKNLSVGGKKKVRGFLLENSGGRDGERDRFVWQFALLPVPADCQTMIGVKRKAPTSWTAGSDGGTPGGPSGGLGAKPDVGGEAGVGAESGDGSGAMSDGVGGSEGLGNSSTEPNGNQVRASSELFRTLLEGVQPTTSTKLTKGLRRFRLRDEWDGADKELTSRFVGIDVPATWRSTPTTALQGRDRIEWTEYTSDGEVAGIVRVAFISARFTGDITTHAKDRLTDWDVADPTFETFPTRDGITQAALFAAEITSDYGLRRGDNSDWVREAGFLMTPHTFYVVESLRPPTTESRVDVLRELLQSVEIFVAQ